MDVDTGEILALTSNPSSTHGSTSAGWMRKTSPTSPSGAANYPQLNRAIAGGYPPGSTFKPFVALAALETGVLSPSEMIQCTGKEVIDGQMFHELGPVQERAHDVSTALANSCDTFFYNVALRFYERKDSPLQRWSRTMGFGSGTASTSARSRRGSCRRGPAPQDVQEGNRPDLDERRLLSWPSARGPAREPAADGARIRMIANGGKLVEPTSSERRGAAERGRAAVVLRPYTPKPPRDLHIGPVTR